MLQIWFLSLKKKPKTLPRAPDNPRLILYYPLWGPKVSIQYNVAENFQNPNTIPALGPGNIGKHQYLGGGGGSYTQT